MAHTKIGNHKKTCEKYRTSGHREINKGLKQKRNEKRMAFFAKRKEDGKKYEYKPISFPKGSNKYELERLKREQKNRSKKDEFSYWKSCMRKLQNYLDKTAEELAQKNRK